MRCDATRVQWWVWGSAGGCSSVVALPTQRGKQSSRLVQNCERQPVEVSPSERDGSGHSNRRCISGIGVAVNTDSGSRNEMKGGVEEASAALLHGRVAEVRQQRRGWVWSGGTG